MIKINLLPTKKTRKRGSSQQQLIIFAAVLVGVGIMLYSVYSSEADKVAKLEQQKTQVQSEMTRLEGIIGDINSIQEKKAELKKKLDIIEMLKKQKIGPVRILDEVSTIIPKRVWLGSLNQVEDMLNFSGMATDHKEVAIFMKNLESSPFFSDVELIFIKQVTDKEGGGALVMQFEINCKYHLPQG